MPVDKDNHGLDETRYVMAKLDNLDGYAVPATTGTIATFAESSIDPWQSGGSNPWT